MTEEMKIAEVDEGRIGEIAAALRGRVVEPVRFIEPEELYPPVGHPRTLEYFFRTVMHQFGFWHLGDDGSWGGSMYAEVDGKRYKGSDFIWRSATKKLMAEEEDLTEFRDDSGVCPLPMEKEHRRMSECSRAYFRNRSPETILETALASDRPVRTMAEELSLVPGYSEDPLAKKAMLLIFVLLNRPEQFLPTTPQNIADLLPVVDYHVMRTALRTGIIRIVSPKTREALVDRRNLFGYEEKEIRQSVYQAMLLLEKESGQSHAALDGLFFMARRQCPEVEDPKCETCLLEPGCAKNKELFQPVFRTEYY